jgi:hypothetical protein
MKIGILTFHRVYNYGAVLQAYCTQKILDDLNIENEIIDFSVPKQKDYTDLYSTKNGLKRFLKTLLLIPLHKKRLLRVRKFEYFIENLNMSEETYYSSNELSKTNNFYDSFMVGSDQVWNVRKKAEFSDAYFLNFVEEGKYKFSYASSVGIADYNDLLPKKNLLSRFDAISCRESGGTQVLKKLTGKDVKNVLDPTLLVDKMQLDKITNECKKSGYLFYYSLDGHDKKDRNIGILLFLCEKYNLKLKILTPEWPYHSCGEDLVDIGPEDFLGLIANADLVCTNSFHGTAISIKLNVPFFVLEDKKSFDERKRSILLQLGLEDRIISSKEDVYNFEEYAINYNKVNAKLEELREQSYAYLEKVIHGGCCDDK